MRREPSDRPRRSTFVHQGEEYVVLSFDAPRPPELPLTPAERRIVALLAEGRSNREIARLRGRALSTIQNQLSALYRRLGVGSRAELVALLMRTRR